MSLIPRETSIQLVVGDDWEGLYVNGELKTQGHSMSVRDVVEALGFSLQVFEPDMEWLDGEGALPKSFADVELKNS